MANLCSFGMVLVGKEENIQLLESWIKQKGDTWIGRGAELYSDSEPVEINEYRIRKEYSGCCKWSVYSALVENAMSMEKQRITGTGMWDIENHKDVKRYITIFDACEELDVDCEIFSEEPGCEFQEHYLFRDGILEVNEESTWREAFPDDFDSKEELEVYLRRKVTEEEFENEDCICSGGFDDYLSFVL